MLQSMHCVSPLLSLFYYFNNLTLFNFNVLLHRPYVINVKIKVKSRTACRRPSRRRPCSPPSAADTAAAAGWRYPARRRGVKRSWTMGDRIQETHPPLEVLALLGVVTHVATIRPGGN